jgi:DNA-directed RNA polymerase specialized sigma24 family protein
MVSDAVVGAILHVSAHFERYHPGRGSLRAFLYGVARRLLGVRLRSERRRRWREQKKAAGPVTRTAAGGQSPADELADRELAERLRASLGLTPEEERVLDLWLLGEKETGVYAAALGLTDRPPEEQTEAVARTLNRLRQRLHRVRLRLRQEGETR